MSVTRYLTGKTPQQSQFGLSQFTEHWKCLETADVVLTDGSVPGIGAAHGTYGNMFVTDRYCVETGESCSALDLVYQGRLGSDFPPVQHESDYEVMSASSSRSSGGATLSSAITVQFYAPTNRRKWFTASGPGDVNDVDDPTADIEVITLQVGDTSYTPGGLIDDIVAAYFSTRITKALQSPEVVTGQVWQNNGTKTKALVPYPFQAVAGDYIVMFAPGSGYSLSDSLTMSDGMGHSATITVTALGIGNSILAWTVSGNTFDYTTPTPIYTSGGSGSGAAFYNYHIT